MLLADSQLADSQEDAALPCDGVPAGSVHDSSGITSQNTMYATTPAPLEKIANNTVITRTQVKSHRYCRANPAHTPATIRWVRERCSRIMGSNQTGWDKMPAIAGAPHAEQKLASAVNCVPHRPQNITDPFCIRKLARMSDRAYIRYANTGLIVP